MKAHHYAISAVLMAIATQAMPMSLSCRLKTERCIVTQGTKLTPKEAIAIGDACAHFTDGDAGRTALRLSYAEIERRSNGKLTPLMKAWFAFDELHASPLKFSRKAKAEETNYQEVKRACEVLDRDFMDDSKWTS